MAGSRGSKAAGGSVAERADLLCEAALAGDRRALARLLTAVENRTPSPRRRCGGCIRWPGLPS